MDVLFSKELKYGIRNSLSFNQSSNAMNMSEIIPKTKKECFALLNEMLSEADKQAISPEILKIF